MSKKLKAIKEASISIACLLDEVENKKIKKDLEHIQNQITIIEQLDYSADIPNALFPQLSTKDINKIVEKHGWKPMDTKDGLAWFGGKSHSCLGDHIAEDLIEDFENIDFLVAGWRRSNENV
tara:strand:+ start:252 stop:617 length:366 start_codon:yes stop_codon:yes gene_type:complete